MRQPHPVIIKRVKKVTGGGHHGGAWKVAYADFVTAMMAFFLLMWLLNATTEDQRKGIADYFNPAIPISQVSGGGKEALSGSTIAPDAKLLEDGSHGKTQMPADEQTQDEKKEKADEAEKKKPLTAEEKGRLQAVEQDLLKRALEQDAGGLARHIQTRMTPEGLVIELVEVNGSPLFEVGSATPSPTMVKLLKIVAECVGTVTNNIAIVGHTDSRPYAGKDGYTNWELSTDRANAARRLMVADGLAPGQIAEVAGKADTEPLTPDPLAPQNRRISITLLKN